MVLLCLKIETQPAAKALCFFKKLDNGQSQKNIVSDNFRHALFSLLVTFGDASLGFALHGPVWHFTCTNVWKKLSLAFL